MRLNSFVLHRTRPSRLAALLLAVACGRASSNTDADAEPCDLVGGCEPAAMDSPDPDTGAASSEEDGSMPADGAAPPTASEPPTCAPRRLFVQRAIAALEGCEVVSGDLHISFAAADLRPLHALRRVEGSLIIVGHDDYEQEIGIASLEGLEQLEQVGGEVMLQSLTAPTLAPLRGLRQVGGQAGEADVDSVFLAYMPALKNLDGLQNLELARTTIDAQSNASLETLEPLVFPREMQGVGLALAKSKAVEPR